MKSLSLLLTLTAFVLVAAGFVSAQGKAKEAKVAVAVKTEAVKKEVSPKPKEYRLGGIITAIDLPAKNITIAQHQVKRERKVTLPIGKGIFRELPDLKSGQAVNAWVKGGTIIRLEEVGWE